MKNIKQCNSCNLIKDISEFTKHIKGKDGLYSFCRECCCDKVKAYNKTKDGVVSSIYRNQRKNSKKRGHTMPTYTKEEIKEWLFSQKKFHLLYDNWKRLDYQRKYKPSIDRKDDFIGYTISNIRLTIWHKNNTKGHSDRKRGVGTQGRICKPVIQLTMNGEIISSYISLCEAERKTNIANSSISKVCNGKLGSAGGFLWKYKPKKAK